MEVSRVRYKDLYGMLVKGTQAVKLDDFGGIAIDHMRKAAYLATMCEAPTWGTVQSYDNAGMSGGPFHFIARYPKDGKQGPLFGLLRRIEQTIGDLGIRVKEFDDLWHMLKMRGWYVAADGKLRAISDGAVISGDAIRDEFAPDHGVVPENGPARVQAERWAVAFAALLSHKATYAAQIDYCITWLLTTQREVELQAYRRFTKLPTLDDLTHVNLSEPVLDLAMCIYHSHSVNAPGAAVDCLKTALKAQPSNDVAFATTLIRLLATKKYGAWDKRYAKTRQVAMQSGFWASHEFGTAGAMPEKF